MDDGFSLMTEDEWSLILANTPGLKRIIEENEAFKRAQFWGGLFRASEAYFADGLGEGEYLVYWQNLAM